MDKIPINPKNIANKANGIAHSTNPFNGYEENRIIKLIENISLSTFNILLTVDSYMGHFLLVHLFLGLVIWIHHAYSG